MFRNIYLRDFSYAEPDDGPLYGMVLKSNGIPKLTIEFNANADRIEFEIPNLKLIEAKRATSWGADVSFTYIFGRLPYSKKIIAPKKEHYQSLSLFFRFRTRDDLMRAFPFIREYKNNESYIDPTLVNPNTWKEPLEGCNYCDIDIYTPNFHFQREYNIDTTDEYYVKPSNVRECVHLLCHLNSTLLQYETLQTMSNIRMKRLIQTVKPAFMRQMLRPPGTFGNENTGGVLYKRGLRNVTEAASAAANTGANARRRRTRKQRRV